MSIKVGHHPFILLIALVFGILTGSCNLPAAPTPGVALIHPANGAFLPLRAYTMDAEAIGGQFSAINFVVNGVTISSVRVDPASPGVMAHYTWTPPVAGEYYLSVDGIGGPGGANRYVSHPAHICVTDSVIATASGYTGTGCAPMPPTPGFTSLHGWPDTIYYDAPVGTPTCPRDITISAEINDISYIDHVKIHFDFLAGSVTTPFGSWEGDIPWKADTTFAAVYLLANFMGVDFSALHGGDGSVSFYAFAFDRGSVRVALSDPITLPLRHCVMSTPTMEPTITPTRTSTFIPSPTARPTLPLPTHTFPPPPPKKVPTNTPLASCNNYDSQKSCEAAGHCKWNGKSCY